MANREFEHENTIVRTGDGYTFYYVGEGYADHPNATLADMDFDDLEALEEAMGSVLDVTCTLKSLYALWDKLGNTTVRMTSGPTILVEPFLDFESGTDVEDIWRWFEGANSEFVVGEVKAGIRKSPGEGKKARVLIQDQCRRFGKGDVGTILPNDSEKYDYKVDLGEIENPNVLDTAFGGRSVVYFYENEIEVLEGE